MTWARLGAALCGVLVCGVLVVCAAVVCLRYVSPHVPPFASVKAEYRPSEAYLLDRNDELLHVSRLDFSVRRLAWTPLEAVSRPLAAAIVEGEDRRFFAHHGVDWIALGAAALGSLTGSQRGGASTLTMQVAALLDPSLAPTTGRRSWRQKLQQVVAALALERQWSKQQILETYLNMVGFRGELVGIAATTQNLFGKVPSGIDDIEAAVLAASLPAPNANVATIARRACALAHRDDASPTRCSAFDAVAATANRPLASARFAPSYAPHVARELLRAPGDRVSSTLDAAVQREVLDVLTAQLDALKRYNVRDGAAIVLDNASGDVLAWVGSAGAASTSPHVDGVRAHRQAGSTLKPFLYGLALERRHLTAASILDDSPLTLETGTGLYIPQNYDREFKGPVTLRTALAASLNVPAVRTLVLIGVEAYRDKLRAFGYRSLTEDGAFYGYSLALGSADVSLLEQANAYRTLANGGLYSPTRLTVHAEADGPRRVMSAAAAFVVADVLSDRGSRAPTFGLDNALTTRFWSAVKTGTSKDMRDNWCIGFTRRYTVGVWVGNFEGDSMLGVSGVSGAAPAWSSITSALHRTGSEAPPPVEGVVSRHVRFETATEPPRDEWFLAGTETSVIRAVDPRVKPQIVSPANGAIIALDPDIPAAHQVLTFVARGASKETSFVLDGAALGTATAVHRVTPSPGAHVLRLIALDHAGNEHAGNEHAGNEHARNERTLDEVRFSVRGPAVRP